MYNLLLLKIPVTSVARSAAFYRDLLGFEEQFLAPEYGWAQYAAGSLGIALYQPGEGGGSRTIGGDVDFHLQIDNLAQLAETLKASGVPIGEGIVRGDDDWEHLVVTDPDGNVLKICGPAPVAEEAE